MIEWIVGSVITAAASFVIMFVALLLTVGRERRIQTHSTSTTYIIEVKP